VRVIGVWDGPEEARRVGEEIERLEREGAPLDHGRNPRARAVPDPRVRGPVHHHRPALSDRRRLPLLRTRRNPRCAGLSAARRQPADDLAFERIYNTPKRGLGDKALEKLHRHARARACRWRAAALEIADSDELPARARTHAAGADARFRALARPAATCSPAELARTMLDESGYTAALQAERSAEAPGGSKTSPNWPAPWRNTRRWAISSNTSAW
jgi:DNA helicase-2/ATP-dependent DNA helicase PcrA